MDRFEMLRIDCDQDQVVLHQFALGWTLSLFVDEVYLHFIDIGILDNSFVAFSGDTPQLSFWLQAM